MASLSDPFVRRPVMTLLLTATVVLFGVLCFRRLPVSDLPGVDFPVIQVSVSYPGASPETMAANIATPLERQFIQIPGMDLITSSSVQGHTSMTLQFNLSKRVDDAATDVQSAINQATGNLPADLPFPPTFSKFNPNDRPILYIALTSESLTRGQLYEYASTILAQRINIVEGVSKVDIFGSRSAIRVKVDPSELARRNMTVDDLAAAIRAGTGYLGAGQVDGATQTFLLQPKGQLDTADAYGALIVGHRGGAPIYLRDVAEVRESIADERSARHFWARGYGSPPAAVTLAVSRQIGANVVATAERVKALLPEFKRDLPGSIQLIPTFDRSLTIIRSVQEVEHTLIIAFVLVVIVVFAFLGRVGDTLIPVIALPMSMLITFTAMYLLGYSIDNLSLLALTLAIGFLVDDAIVFLENTVRRMEGGETALQATLNGAKEISFTILSMTFSLAAVFIPMVFMPGLIGRVFQQFAITIIIAILASGLVSLTLTPLMCARMLQKHSSGKQTWLERNVGVLIRKVVGLYGRSLWFFLRHRWISLFVWAVSLAGSVWLLYVLPKSFLPTGDSGFVRGIFMAQEGTAPDELRACQNKVDAILSGDPAVNIAMTISGLSGRTASSQALVLAFLKPLGERPPISEVIARLSKRIAQVPGISPFLQAMPVIQISSGATANTQGQFAYSVTGIEAAQVYKSAEELAEQLRAYPGFLFVNSDLKRKTPSIEIDILREQASSYGISAQRVLTALRNAYAQNFVYLIKTPTDQYQVILEVEDAKRRRPDDLGLLYLRSDDGERLVPLKAVARWREVIGPQSVNHINQLPSVTIFFNLVPGTAIGDAAQFIETTAARVLPPGVRGRLEGEAKVFKETVAQLAVLMIFAIFAMYVILGILYESFIHPITVLSALPVATVGGLATLAIFGKEADLYAFVGMFLLIGLVKKNGIIMIDFAIQRMHEGLGPVEAAHEACVERFRPIMMTTAAALMGAVPLALGLGADGASRQPLGLIVVGGLLVSQLLTLYVTPAIFLYLEKVQERYLDRIPLLRSHGAHAAKAAAGGG